MSTRNKPKIWIAQNSIKFILKKFRNTYEKETFNLSWVIKKYLVSRVENKNRNAIGYRRPGNEINKRNDKKKEKKKLQECEFKRRILQLWDYFRK